MTVREMLSRMTYIELDEWSQWYELNPANDEAVCAQVAVLCAVVANANRRKGARPFAAKDFSVINRMRPKPKMTSAAMAAHFLAITKQLGGTIINV